MKDFFFIFRNSADEIGKLTEPMKKEYQEKWNNWFKKLTEDGSLADPGARLVVADAKTIKSSNKVITDGPYTESKEIIAGFIKVSAEDVDDAAKIAKGCPIFEVNGSLEIRTSYYM